MLPEFLEFAAGAVLVAHNASFDVGFVDAELSRLRGRRLAAPVLDTVMLARRLLAGRLPRMNLGTLAERFDTEVRPCHRALPDAQATGEVLAALLGLAQERGARTVADAISLAGPARRSVRRRRDLARDVPRGPGVYLFRDGTEHVLYVGKASDLRARVRSYFSGPPQRRAVEHALAATERVETRPLGSELEAALVELELIGRLRPPANSRNAHPERACYLTLTHGDLGAAAGRHRPAAADLRDDRSAAVAQPRAGRRGGAAAPPSASAPAGRRCRTARRDAWPACSAPAGRRAAAAPTPSGTRRRCSRSAPGWRRGSSARSCGRSGCGWRPSPRPSATRTRRPRATSWRRWTASAGR